MCTHDLREYGSVTDTQPAHAVHTQRVVHDARVALGRHPARRRVVPRRADVPRDVRVERGVGAFFGHNLASVNHDTHKATFKTADGSVEVDYTLLHVTPPMGPLEVVKNSPIADQAGWVAVDQGTLRHTNPEFGNVWALGDCSSLPTSKTAAAVTAQAPVLTENVFAFVDTGKLSEARYDGYTSCPVRSLLFLFESAVDRSAEKRSNFESGVLQEVDRKYDFGSDCFRIP